MKISIYKINPTPKPRMTKSDKWKKRPATQRYYAFKDQVREQKIKLPESNYHVIFVVQMPKTWTKKKKNLHRGKQHQQVPDKDNLEKALLDAIYDDDSKVWDGRVSKFWGDEGFIIIRNAEPIKTIKEYLSL